ncbi:MAG: ABC transporter permease [Gammaproteobacteria bacterium]|nr:ABC transporter permease [Gammaproteobacteria bacterium]MBU1722386.1 ABC transporter permease [Gammaproteobacteria bacterium]MBU2004677.1 ABC transporter permease [Gammaproteobacteria bacterium]
MARLTLLWQLLRRDVQERYAGTVLGVFWLLAQPLFMLLVYALVFGEVLQLRLGTQTDSASFAVWLFAGLSVFNALAEVLVRAPAILAERRDLLLNSPLPPALLPLLPVGASLVLELLSVGLLLLWLCVQGQCHWQSVFLYPPLLLLRVLLSLALAYGLAVLGVFLRDLRQMMPPLLSVLLLVSPIVYPQQAVPEKFHAWFAWNPLAQLVQAYRAVLLDGVFPWETFAVLLMLALLSLGLAVLLFQRLMPRARYVL